MPWILPRDHFYSKSTEIQKQQHRSSSVRLPIYHIALRTENLEGSFAQENTLRPHTVIKSVLMWKPSRMCPPGMSGILFVSLCAFWAFVIQELGFTTDWQCVHNIHPPGTTCWLTSSRATQREPRAPQWRRAQAIRTELIICKILCVLNTFERPRQVLPLTVLLSIATYGCSSAQMKASKQNSSRVLVRQQWTGPADPQAAAFRK